MTVPIGLILAGAAQAFKMVASMRNGDRRGLIEAAQQFGNTGQAAGFPPKARPYLSVISAALETVGERGQSIDEAKSLIIKADTEDRDLTNEECERFFAGTDAIADRVEDKLQAKERAAEARKGQ